MLDELLTIGLTANTVQTRAPLGQLLTGPENRLVVWAARQLLEAEPLVELVVFVGPSGVGKTLASVELVELWRTEHPSARIVQTTAADFARNLSHARKADAVDDFRAKHRDVDLLVIDGLEDLSERTTAQEELVRTLDALRETGGRTVITMRSLPTETRALGPMLTSRLSGGLTVPVELPNESTRRAVIEHFADRLQATIDPPAAEMLAARLQITVPEIHGWLVRLASETNHHLTADAVCEALDAGETGERAGPELAEIATVVAKRCRVKKSEMQGPARRASLVRARGLAMLAARRLAKKSLSEIGRYFGGRDHTTVLHACRKTEELLTTDPQWAAVWNELASDLKTA